MASPLNGVQEPQGPQGPPIGPPGPDERRAETDAFWLRQQQDPFFTTILPDVLADAHEAKGFVENARWIGMSAAKTFADAAAHLGTFVFRTGMESGTQILEHPWKSLLAANPLTTAFTWDDPELAESRRNANRLADEFFERAFTSSDPDVLDLTMGPFHERGELGGMSVGQSVDREIQKKLGNWNAFANGLGTVASFGLGPGAAIGRGGAALVRPMVEIAERGVAKRLARGAIEGADPEQVGRLLRSAQPLEALSHLPEWRAQASNAKKLMNWGGRGIGDMLSITGANAAQSYLLSPESERAHATEMALLTGPLVAPLAKVGQKLGAMVSAGGLGQGQKQALNAIYDDLLRGTIDVEQADDMLRAIMPLRTRQVMGNVVAGSFEGTGFTWMQPDSWKLYGQWLAGDADAGAQLVGLWLSSVAGVVTLKHAVPHDLTPMFKAVRPDLNRLHTWMEAEAVARLQDAPERAEGRAADLEADLGERVGAAMEAEARQRGLEELGEKFEPVEPAGAVVPRETPELEPFLRDVEADYGWAEPHTLTMVRGGFEPELVEGQTDVRLRFGGDRADTVQMGEQAGGGMKLTVSNRLLDILQDYTPDRPQEPRRGGTEQTFVGDKATQVADDLGLLGLSRALQGGLAYERLGFREVQPGVWADDEHGLYHRIGLDGQSTFQRLTGEEGKADLMVAGGLGEPDFVNPTLHAFKDALVAKRAIAPDPLVDSILVQAVALAEHGDSHGARELRAFLSEVPAGTLTGLLKPGQDRFLAWQLGRLGAGLTNAETAQREIARAGQAEQAAEQAAPDGPNFAREDAARDWLRRQGRELEGEARVRVGANVARLLTDWFPQNSRAGKQLAAMQEQNGGTLDLSAKEASRFLDYYARRAERVREGDEGHAATQALDSFARKVVEAFGLPPDAPMGEPVEGAGQPSPDRPLGQPYRPEVSAEPTPVEGPGERGPDVEVTPQQVEPPRAPPQEPPPDAPPAAPTQEPTPPAPKPAPAPKAAKHSEEELRAMSREAMRGMGAAVREALAPPRKPQSLTQRALFADEPREPPRPIEPQPAPGRQEGGFAVLPTAREVVDVAKRAAAAGMRPIDWLVTDRLNVLRKVSGDDPWVRQAEEARAHGTQLFGEAQDLFRPGERALKQLGTRWSQTVVDVDGTPTYRWKALLEGKVQPTGQEAQVAKSMNDTLLALWEHGRRAGVRRLEWNDETGQSEWVPLRERDRAVFPRIRGTDWDAVMFNDARRNRLWEWVIRKNRLRVKDEETGAMRPATPQDLDAQWRERTQGLKQRDVVEEAAIEFARQWKHFPDVFERHHLLEQDPFEAMRSLMKEQSQRIGAVRVWGQDFSPEARYAIQKAEPGVQLKPGGRAALAEFKGRLTNQGQRSPRLMRMADELLVSLQGGSPHGIHPFFKWSAPVEGLIRSAKTMFTGVHDIPAPFVQGTAYAGWNRARRAIAYVARSPREGIIAAERAGTLLRSMGMHDFREARNWFQKAGDVLSLPSTVTERLKTATFDRMAVLMLDDWAVGKVTNNDRDVLGEMLNFRPDQIAALTSGRASDVLKTQFRRDFVKLTTGRRTQAEGSEFLARPNLQALVRFGNWISGRTVELGRITRSALRPGATLKQRARAFRRAAILFGGWGASGIATTLMSYLIADLWKGENGWDRWVDELSRGWGPMFGRGLKNQVIGGPVSQALDTLADPERDIGRLTSLGDYFFSIREGIEAARAGMADGPIGMLKAVGQGAYRAGTESGAIPSAVRDLAALGGAALAGQSLQTRSDRRRVAQWKRMEGIKEGEFPRNKSPEFYDELSALRAAIETETGEPPEVRAKRAAQVAATNLRRILGLGQEESVASAIRGFQMLDGIDLTQRAKLGDDLGDDQQLDRIYAHDLAVREFAKLVGRMHGEGGEPFDQELQLAEESARHGGTDVWRSLVDRATDDAMARLEAGQAIGDDIQQLAESIAAFPGQFEHMGSFSARQVRALERANYTRRVRMVSTMLRRRAQQRVLDRAKERKREAREP